MAPLGPEAKEQTGAAGAPAKRPAPLRLVRRLLAVGLGLGAVMVASAIVSSGIGATHIPVSDLIGSFIARLRGETEAETIIPNAYAIFWDHRLPRIALGALVGGALSMAGGSLQGLLLNPLADPYLIGVSAGAALGAALAIITNTAEMAGGLGRTLAGFGAAIVTLAVVYRLALRNGRVGRESFILAGVVVGSFMWAFVTLIMAISEGGQLANVISWLLGNLVRYSSWQGIGWVAPVILIAGMWLYAYSRDLNLLALGEEPAQQLGVDVERMKRAVILLAALLTAAAVSVSGIIGFVGLIIPHMARRIWGADHRILLPASALLGAIFLIWADTLARVIIRGSELPVGVITSLLGAPFFCYLLVTAVRRQAD